MKTTSVHFVLGKGSDYKDLAPIFLEMFKMLLEEIEHVLEDEGVLEMFIETNVSDLLKNRKPEGYNRKGRIRLVFPMDRKEFYLKTYSKNADLNNLTTKYTALMKEAKIKFEVTQNDDLEFE